jgi:hypothetical protein
VVLGGAKGIQHKQNIISANIIICK